MEIKKVTVDVYDARLFYLLVKELKRLKIRLVPENGDIVISDHNTGDIQISSKEEIPKVIGKVLCKVKGKDKFNELVIGIDTNKNNLAIAVVGDGDLIDYYKVNEIKLKETIENILDTIPHERVLINVGIGNSMGFEIYRRIKEEFKDNVYPIDEFNTSKNKITTRIKDEDILAAYNIALRTL